MNKFSKEITNIYQELGLYENKILELTSLIEVLDSNNSCPPFLNTHYIPVWDNFIGEIKKLRLSSLDMIQLLKEVSAKLAFRLRAISEYNEKEDTNV